MSKACKFDKAWVGRCNKPVVEGSEYCDEHDNQKCSANVGDNEKHESCGNQATHSCYETYALVCGMPLCDEHKGNVIA